MKPSRSILDESFNYVSAAATSVTETWRRFGWRPNAERQQAVTLYGPGLVPYYVISENPTLISVGTE